MLAAKTQSPRSKSTLPAEKAKSSAHPPAETAFNPVWGRLALGIQPKLKVSAPDDPYEREADLVADRIMRMPEPAVQRMCAACSAGGATCPSCEEEERRVQRKPEEASGAGSDQDEEGCVQCRAEPEGAEDTGEAPSIVEETLRAGRGRPLDAEARAYFEPRFGQDFSRVRVHTDERAGASASAVNALAYTAGPDVVFGTGRYAPAAPEGRRLLAHELTHVVQQRSTSFGSGVRLQRQPAGMGQSDCGAAFKRKFGGKINQEKPEAHRGVPRMYHATTTEHKEIPGEPVEPLVTGTELDVGQTGGYAGLWRAVCFKTQKMRVQILWVLNEYILNLDDQRRKDQEKKRKDAEERKPGGDIAPIGDETPPAQPQAPIFIGSSVGETAAVGTEVEYKLYFRTPPLNAPSIRWFHGRVVNGEVQPLKLHGFPGHGVTYRHLWEEVGKFTVVAVVGPDSDESHVTFNQSVVTAEDKDSPLTKGVAANTPISAEDWLADRDNQAARRPPLSDPIQSSVNPAGLGNGEVELSITPLEGTKSFFWFVQPTDPDGFQQISDPRSSGVWRGEWRGMRKTIYRGQKVLVSSAAGSNMSFPLARVGTYIVSCEERDGDGKELRTSQLVQEIRQAEKVNLTAVTQRQEFVEETNEELAKLDSEGGKKKAVPVRAEFLAKAGGRSDHLFFFIGPEKEGGGLVLIDLQRGVSQRSYYGGNTAACFDEFGSKRSYPPGKISFKVPAKPEWGIDAWEKVLDVEPSPTDKAIAIIGQLAGLAAAPLFFIAPPLAAALQIISSAANIWENYRTGSLLTAHTAIDVMMMAAAFVPLGEALVVRLEAKGLKDVAGMVGKCVHVVGLGSGVAGGVLLNQQGLKHLGEINGSSKSPEEKTQEMAQALLEMVQGMLLLAVVVLPEVAGPEAAPRQAEPQDALREAAARRPGPAAADSLTSVSEPMTLAGKPHKLWIRRVGERFVLTLCSPPPCAELIARCKELLRGKLTAMSRTEVEMVLQRATWLEKELGKLNVANVGRELKVLTRRLEGVAAADSAGVAQVIEGEAHAAGKELKPAAPQPPSAATLAAGGGIPRLKVASGAAMYREMKGHLLAAPPGQRLAMYQDFAEQIQSAAPREWGSIPRRVTNAAAMFEGEAKEALVFTEEGEMFRGSTRDPKAFKVNSDGSYTVDFESEGLRQWK
jgi:hypothetical protein